MGRRSDHTRQELQDLILNAAREMIRETGVDSVSSRKIAEKIGYTVGTVFQVFGSMDNLIGVLNVRTLESLHEFCLPALDTADTEQRLNQLAASFINFAEANKNEWDAVISYRYNSDQTHTDDYQEQVNNLMTLIGDATRHLYDDQNHETQQSDIRLLWASIYGIFVLSAAGRLPDGYDTTRMIRLLTDMFLAARNT